MVPTGAITEAAWEFDGTPAGRVVAPRDTAELQGLLAEGEASGEVVAFRGAGSKLDWGSPPEVASTPSSTSPRFPARVEHAAGDLVVRVSASVGLAALNAELARAGQRLALDEVVPGSSIGGVIATGLSGPLRFAFGSVRDLLIGITVVRADGHAARAGGRVVKNVAGYDLGKLFTGSLGTLGAITEAHFRLHPLPATSARLTAIEEEPAAAAALVRRLATSTLAPVAIELERPSDGSYAVTVLLEGSERSVRRRRAEQLRGRSRPLLPAFSAPPLGWGELPGRSTLKLTFAPGALGPLLRSLSGALPAGALLRGAAAVGILLIGVTGEEELAPLLGTVRAHAVAAGGRASVLRAPRERREGLDLFGPLPAPQLQRAVKASFDPGGRLAPGRLLAA